MKRRTVRTYIVCACLGFLAIAFFNGACNGAGEERGEEGEEGETNGTLTAPTLTAPTVAAIRTALGVNNPFGMIPGLALGDITPPECTTDTSSQTLTYSMSGLPDWLAFNATTRALTLAEGTAVVPQEANTAAEVTYTCTMEAAATTNYTSTASVSFTVNDLDGGGVVDGKEYQFGEVPLLSTGAGWIWLTPAIVNHYRTAEASPRKIPTGIMITSVGMNPTDAADDTGDFDGDGSSNADEITNGTNIFVATSAGTFAEDSEPNAGSNPKGITAADLDNDGDLDLIVTNKVGLGSIRPFLNNGSGAFTMVDDYNTQTNPEGLAAADFNGDGNMDISASNSGSSSVSVLMGNGDGTFGTQALFTVGVMPENIVAADFNGDGDVDLATANANTDNVSVLLGAGDGTFAATNFAAGVEPSDLVFADFDADGDLDLAVANLNGTTISILTNNGSGSFTQTSVLIPQEEPRTLTTADFNGDGAIDIAALIWTGIGTQNINMFLNNGNGTFADYTVVPFDNKPYDIVAADLDGDGDIDLAATAHSGNVVGVFLSNGDGTFTATNYTVGDSPWGIVAADLDGDGKLDLAVANSGGGSNSVSIMLNQ